MIEKDAEAKNKTLSNIYVGVLFSKIVNGF